jgi:hypothetical protein
MLKNSLFILLILTSYSAFASNAEKFAFEEQRLLNQHCNFSIPCFNLEVHQRNQRQKRAAQLSWLQLKQPKYTPEERALLSERLGYINPIASNEKLFEIAVERLQSKIDDGETEKEIEQFKQQFRLNDVDDEQKAN